MTTKITRREALSRAGLLAVSGAGVVLGVRTALYSDGRTQEWMPERISADQNSPYFDPYWSMHVRIFVNGKEVTASGPERLAIVEADRKEGWIRYHVLDRAGATTFRQEIRSGVKVEFRHPVKA
jgi:hypothetical protein